MFPAVSVAASVKVIFSFFGLLGMFGGLGFGSLVLGNAMADSIRSSRSRAIIITVFFGISGIHFILNRKILLSTAVLV